MSRENTGSVSHLLLCQKGQRLSPCPRLGKVSSRLCCRNPDPCSSQTCRISCPEMSKPLIMGFDFSFTLWGFTLAIKLHVLFTRSSSPVEMIMSFRILPDMYQTLYEKELNETLRTGDHINNGEPRGGFEMSNDRVEGNRTSW